jgi:antitoxin HicB
MSHEYAFPMEISVDEAGFYLVTFPDVPEAGTDGSTEEEARMAASDSLIAALGGYIGLRKPIPRPSPAARGQAVLYLPPLVCAKLALYQAMIEAGLSAVALGRRLGVSEGAVRRLLDLDHRSHLDHIEAALEMLGKRLVVGLEAA